MQHLPFVIAGSGVCIHRAWGNDQASPYQALPNADKRHEIYISASISEREPSTQGTELAEGGSDVVLVPKL